MIQATAVTIWWAVLHLFPESIWWFHPVDWPAESLFSFRIPDVVLLVLGSLLAALTVILSKAWAHVAVWSVAIAAWYPTLYCLGASIETDSAWLATASMTCMSGISLIMATMVGNGSQAIAVIRETRLSRTGSIAWTAIQVVIFWSVFLWILPKSIVEIQQRLELPFFAHVGQLVAAALLFLTASWVGLWSALAMTTRGCGTPLPTATAPVLVVSGPYRIVRNPMALAGILQGIAVGWAMGSWLVILYSMAGAVVWHLIARPTEEADLLDRFGDQYLRYQREVGLWVPRIFSRTD